MADRARKPPNIDEVGNLVLLKQVLDLLAAPGPAQLAAYPVDREAGREIALLFDDALARVRPVFWPSFPPEARDALLAIRRGLDAAPRSDEAVLEGEAWRELRELAARATPIPSWLPSAPRGWRDQIVRHRGRLRLRRQVQEELACP